MKSKMFVICLMCIFCIPCSIFSQSLPASYRGDVNSDEEVNIVDALLIAQHYVGLIRLIWIEADMADVNVDRAVDIIDALLVAQFYVELPVQLECLTPIDSISMKDVVHNPEHYIGDNREISLRVTRIEAVTVHDFYGNTEDGYSVYVMDEYNYEASFYITMADYSIFEPLMSITQWSDFILVGTDGPYMESHVSGFPYRISAKPHPDYFGMWSVYINLR